MSDFDIQMLAFAIMGATTMAIAAYAAWRS